MSTTPIELAERLDAVRKRLRYWKLDEEIRAVEATLSEAARALRASGGVGVTGANRLLQIMLDEIAAGRIDSEEFPGDLESGIPPHKFHEEWAHNARAALTVQAQPSEEQRALDNFDRIADQHWASAKAAVSSQTANAELLIASRHLVNVAENFARRFSISTLSEDNDQQRQSVLHHAQGVRRAITNAEAALSAPVGEPAFWLMQQSGEMLKGTRMKRVAEIWQEQGHVVIPAYATAPAPAANGEALALWRVGTWGNGSTKPGFVNIFCDAWQTTIVEGIFDDEAEKIVEAHNAALTASSAPASPMVEGK